MSYRRNISPNVLQRNAVMIHRVKVPSVVFDFATAMSARLYRSTNAPECFRLPFGVVEKAVMAWMEAPRNGQRGGNFDCNPVSEFHSQFLKVRSKKNVPFREILKKECAAWFYCSNAL